MFIVDAHQDIAYNALCYGRDYRTSALKKRTQEAGSDIPARAGMATIGLPEALAGRVAVVFATLFVAPRSRGAAPSPWANLEYDDAAGAHRLARQQLDVYRRLVDEDDRLRLVRSAADLDAVLATWQPGVDVRQRRQGLLLLMEGADPIVEPPQFEEWYELGVRAVGPAWQRTRYAGGTRAPGPLTALGRELLDVMAGFNAILDVSHLAERSYYDAVEQYTGTIIASHSNPRSFCDTDRHLSDDMIRRLADRDGVMGVVLANYFLDGGWQRSDGKHAVTLDRVLDIIDHICQVTGSAAHVAIGSDFDGGFGAETIPAEIDTVADLWRFQERLLGRGFSEADTDAILSGNMLRQLRKSLPAT